MLDCAEKGGTQCKIDVVYDNQCAAVVVGSNGYNVGNAATPDKVAKLGLKVCTDAKGVGCHVYYSACSLPERIQ